LRRGADIAVSRSDLNRLILRRHVRTARDDVAATRTELLHEPPIGRQILELDSGSTPIEEAVRANVRS
jgi:hypothetical protein